jgi:hypothetical protein
MFSKVIESVKFVCSAFLALIVLLIEHPLSTATVAVTCSIFFQTPILLFFSLNTFYIVTGFVSRAMYWVLSKFVETPQVPSITIIERVAQAVPTDWRTQDVILVVLCVLMALNYLKPTYKWVPEAMQEGSSLEEAVLPKFQVKVVAYGEKVLSGWGSFISHNGQTFLLTANHIVRGTDVVFAEAKNGLSLKLLSSTKKLVGPDVVAYSVDAGALSTLGIRVAKTGVVLQTTTASIVGPLRSYGMLYRLDNSMLNYTGSTMPGFSGAPLFSSNKIHAIHTGSLTVQGATKNMAVDIGLILTNLSNNFVDPTYATSIAQPETDLFAGQQEMMDALKTRKPVLQEYVEPTFKSESWVDIMDREGVWESKIESVVKKTLAPLMADFRSVRGQLSPISPEEHSSANSSDISETLDSDFIPFQALTAPQLKLVKNWLKQNSSKTGKGSSVSTAPQNLGAVPKRSRSKRMRSSSGGSRSRRSRFSEQQLTASSGAIGFPVRD